ncbi:alkaline phosphatase D family protein [Porticoccus sp. GXU_MW_L64]
MAFPISRRRFLRAATTSGVVLGGWSNQVLAALAEPAGNQLFSHGVASGDPTHTSLIIWTRVSAQGDTPVSWELFADKSLQNPIQRGSVITNSSRDHTVKIDVQNLKPGQTYYYRFRCNGISSEPGRTRTLPAGSLDKLTLAVASCSNYAFGYFNGYEVIAADPDVDFVLHLGDYIYEYGGENAWSAETGRQLGREHIPPHETVTLEDYRLRHGQYKTDQGSRLMHASHPLIPTWDDHESANNPYMHGAQNHQPGSEGEWTSRRNASVQAYYEWMPIREPGKGMKREQLWRHFTFGDLASLTTLETRHSGRDKQIDYGEHLPNIHTPQQRQEFLSKVLGDPERNMISAEMTQFFADSLAESVANQRPWKLIGNQIPMARTHMPKIRDKVPSTEKLPPEVLKELDYYLNVGDQDLPLFLDTWDGYPAARERLYQLARQQGVSDFLVLTGDSHAFWANQLFDDSGNAMGVELGAPGITSPGDFEPYSPDAARQLDHMMAEHNKEVLWTDCLHRGFVKLMLTRDKAEVDFITVDNVKDRRFKTKILRQIRIAHKNGSLAFGGY